jgi:hypothetical protein
VSFRPQLCSVVERIYVAILVCWFASLSTTARAHVSLPVLHDFVLQEAEEKLEAKKKEEEKEKEKA